MEKYAIDAKNDIMHLESDSILLFRCVSGLRLQRAILFHPPRVPKKWLMP